MIDQPLAITMPSTGVILAILTLAIFSTAFAYLLFFQLLSSSGAVNVSLVTLLIPVSAILLGTVFLGEILLTRHIIGMIFIFIGLMTVDGRIFHLANIKRA